METNPLETVDVDCPDVTNDGTALGAAASAAVNKRLHRTPDRLATTSING